MIKLRDCVAEELFKAHNWAEVVEEYGKESPVTEYFPAKVNEDYYYNAEKAGALRSIGIFEDDKVVGFSFYTTMVLPHFSIQVTATDSIFVLKNYRMAGWGLKLRNAVEDKAKEAGSVGVVISAPSDGILMKGLMRDNYVPMNMWCLRKF